LEAIRFGWKQSGLVGSNQVLSVVLRIWHDDGTISIMGEGWVHSWMRFGCNMERVSLGDDSWKCIISTGGLAEDRFLSSLVLLSTKIMN
jgi:hypothetical protein